MVECAWCGRSFTPRHGGSPARFCSPGHRAAYHAAVRRWADGEIAAGRLTVARISDGSTAACTLLPYPRSSLPPNIALPDPALLATLRAFGRIVIRVPVAPEGIAELVALGWLAPRQCRNPEAVAEAIIGLAGAALGAGLRGMSAWPAS